MGLFGQQLLKFLLTMLLIQAVIDAAVNGDTVLVADGVYSENIKLIVKS